MSAITPNTNLRLLKVPIEIDEKNQITFTSLQNQYNYFNSLPKIEKEGFTYQRKDSVIRFPAHIDSIIEYNYVMYQNENYTNKWFYAFITDMQYISNGMTAITIKTDVYQTWFNDLTYKACFVEREHVNNDSIGLHTIPEGLETGDYISCDLQPTFYNMPETCFVVATSYQWTQGYTFVNQDLPIGVYYYGATTIQGIQDIIKIHDNAGKGDAINSVFVGLKDFFTSWGSVTGVDGQVSTTVRFDYSNSITVSTVNYLGNSYVPRNKKLLTFPYSFLQVSNHSGQIINYKWENFNLLDVGTTDIEFSIKGTITPGGSIKAFPINYNNMLNNFDDNIVGAKLPIGAYSNDVYTNWLTQNGVNIGLNLLSSGMQVASGIGLMATGAGAIAGGGAIASGLMGVANTMGSVYEHSLIPDSVSGNVSCGDINFTLGLSDFEFKRMSIKNEYAKIIDSYFDMFGYKVNTVKIPNITGRSNWNYVKTIDCNIVADIPQNDLQEIKDMFNKGVTLWHNTSTFLNYSVSNSIVS